jgi:hypothetical protein
MRPRASGYQPGPRNQPAARFIKGRDLTLMERPDMPLTASDSANELLLYRIRGEYLEMPGLRLTLEQAARLWHMDTSICASALMRLVTDRFLMRTRSGAYVRLDQA